MRRDGEEVHLTPIEFDLLRVLVRKRGRLMTHRALLTEVWGPGYADDTQALRTHIANLRRKIEPAGERRATSAPSRASATGSPSERASSRDLHGGRRAVSHAALDGSRARCSMPMDDRRPIAIALVVFARCSLLIEGLDRI